MCVIVARDLGVKCHLFLAKQPLTWHVQRSLLLFDYFGAKIHYSKGYGLTALKAILFRLIHPSIYVMLPGGSLLLGKGNPLGTVGFINAMFELNKQIENKELKKPDIIFVAGGSTGTAAGLIAGAKLLGLNIKFQVVAVSDEMFVNKESIMMNSNKALQYLQDLDDTLPKVEVAENDFEVITGYLGSEYGVKTKRGQNAVDLVMKLEGKRKGFKLETTYTGKAVAGMLDFIEKNEDNRSKTFLFWNTYNSNDLDYLLREIGLNWKRLPRKLHQFYENKVFQCWQIKDCSPKIREKCPAYLNHEYRCWKIRKCDEDQRKTCKAYEELTKTVPVEDA